jgi:hypothetical protein
MHSSTKNTQAISILTTVNANTNNFVIKISLSLFFPFPHPTVENLALGIKSLKFIPFKKDLSEGTNTI